MCQNNRTMKLHHILYTLLLISLFPITSNGQPARKEKLRVISYNIWNGFEHDASRRANFIDWIKGQQPDILAITELVGFTEKNLGQLASEYGHKYYAIVKEEGYPVGITSNKPITVVKKQVEDLVNKWINEDLPVTIEEMSKEDAIKSGAECMFIEKYPDIVTVYSIGDVSKELCGGPHVKNTKVLGTFKIKKEEACSAGVRRIKAILE